MLRNSELSKLLQTFNNDKRQTAEEAWLTAEVFIIW